MRYLESEELYVLECSGRRIKEVRSWIQSPPRPGIPMEWQIAGGKEPYSVQERVELAAAMANAWLSWAVQVADEEPARVELATPKLVRVN